MAVIALLSTVPVGLGLFLLAFGVPDRPLLASTPRNLAAVAVVAVAIGPVAQLALGFAGWLALIGAVVTATVVGAGARVPRRDALHE